MKLISAGAGVSEKPYTQLQFNCTRNQNCQKAFYVPVEAFSDIVFFVDLTGKPTTTLIEVLNVCDIDNVGGAVSGSFVVGQQPGGAWYGVFGGLVVTPPIGVTYTRFFFKFTFTIAGVDHVFYSQQYEFPWCGSLTYMRGCYPNVTVGSNAVDCNGVYYGFPTNEDFLGDENYRYIHSGFLRMASIIEQNNKFTFTAFNSKKIYKSVFNREWIFEFELVPTFYKDHLIGIFNRGNVQVQGSEWKLADEQNISIVDVDSKIWKMDMIFDNECKQSFGCKPADCVFPVPPPPDCCEPVLIDASVEFVEPEEPFNIIDSNTDPLIDADNTNLVWQ